MGAVSPDTFPHSCLLFKLRACHHEAEQEFPLKVAAIETKKRCSGSRNRDLPSVLVADAIKHALVCLHTKVRGSTTDADVRIRRREFIVFTQRRRHRLNNRTGGAESSD